ncbi:hypothetical protein J5N97_005112 [Dioscorea zingiberensis]|uniref:Uncharacterized protein n=1 Tax=Dioscorea zingiberensis TaxID=325984 RepID=A0A9D5D7Y7_9LILI|nr:hypothetical protein J5N97_005112 [Dioscorea zingiberensis]
MGECEALRQMVDAHSGKKRAGAEEALWWAAPLDGVGLDQLVARKEMTQALRRDVLARIGELERVALASGGRQQFEDIREAQLGIQMPNAVCVVDPKGFLSMKITFISPLKFKSSWANCLHKHT